jgi:hypothetical protein
MDIGLKDLGNSDDLNDPNALNAALNALNHHNDLNDFIKEPGHEK